MSKLIWIVCCATALMFVFATLPGCSSDQEKVPETQNPFFADYGTPFETPAFDRIKVEHFVPAVEEGIKRHQAEVDAIIENPDAPTFANTMQALDRTGEFLERAAGVFYSLMSADTTPQLQAAAKEIAPRLSAHSDNISLNEKLFARVKALYEQRDELGLDAEQAYMLEHSYKDFVRSGALLTPEQKTRMREINQRLSLLGLQYGENLLKETNESYIVIENEADLAGLPETVINMGKETAEEYKMPGKWVYTTQRASMYPFLQYSQNRPLREKLYRAYFMRGDRENEYDNKAILKEIMQLRIERTRMLGYETPAHFYLETRMAGTPQRVNEFLMQLWKPALERARAEVAEMQAIIDREGGDFKLQSWDWWYYAEKLRREKYELDDAELRPYFELENVKKGIFYLCNQLYGLTFEPRSDIQVYNKEVQVYEVKEADGSHLGIVYMDFHPRSSKRGGAWSGGFRDGWTRDGEKISPLSTVTGNFTRPAGDVPSLLSIDEVTTFFHEFGHALNTLFSNGRYQTRHIPRDAVELPSQIMENWALEPELLAVYARHYKTGEVIPDELVEKIRKSSLFNQGFDTVEYLAASILDQAWHGLLSVDDIDVNAFEKKVLDGIGLIPEIQPRYRSTYFSHIISGYSAGYYSYIWSGVLDSDAFAAFKETSLFNQELAAKFRLYMLEKLGREDSMELYKKFRGREPDPKYLLKRRGLL